MDDVTVVGGSAAGVFTAYLLSRGGRPVRVLERASSLETTPRTLIVTSRMADLLGGLGDKAVVNRIERFEMFANGSVATIALQRPDLVVERSTLIRELAEHARTAGAELVFGRQLLGVEPNGHGLTLTVGSSDGVTTEQRTTGTLVGADGAFSAVARAAGWPQQPTVPLLQAVVRLPADVSPETTRVWFDPVDTRYFYWLVPESPTRGVVGLIGEDPRSIRGCLERFLERQRLEPLEFQAARIPIYERWIPHHRRVGNSNVYLVGDAAGQVKPTTVGGIVTGFRGALGVAEAILKDRASRELRALRRELTCHLLIRRALHYFSQADYTRLFDFLNRSTRRLLSVNTRDELSTMLWKLCLRQPRFVLLGVRVLLSRSLHPRS
jgi:digeranylgeranylglycerophospholipid reductase